MVFVTTTVKDWIPIFNNHKYATLFLDTMVGTLVQFNVSLTAYVLMPSHFHALLGFKQIENLSKVIQSVKSISSRRIKTLLSENEIDLFSTNGVFQFWKPRFDDLIIKSEKQFKIKMEYIHNNPVKAGLVSQSTDYIYSSAASWLNSKSDQSVIKIERNWEWLE